ncbi:ribonuclease R [Clostridium botulinum D/C]|uniref:ribonuclease R n=1 Tax=Clostridium botulinum TaxID=1491 RepID=UPI001E3693F2|nr:ribonuclease R [Clostridium botulinum]MCD3351408.1 ribonuclease R [Clostridium botulinum D/C]MCD3360364.1 ribonuclease R [Clostridium botulinum D/C]MCD3361893.1 ribonuclease R [Clostridium botulinum D/C]MCD3366169.1 ribonuclease R [Clostridium botulinum D/C]
MNIKTILLGFMKEQAYKPMDIQELSRIFGISKKDMKSFKELLKTMEKEGSVIKTRTNHYGIPEKMGLVVGRLQGHQRGYGFVIPEDGSPDLFVISSYMNGAMHGDRVVAQVLKEENNGKRREGEIIRVTERANETIIGVFEASKNFGFVVPEEKRIHQDIFIPKEHTNGATNGDVVIVNITQWPEKRRNPEGKVVEVLGKKGEKGIDILTIIKKYKLPEEFPAKVKNYALNIPQEIPEEEFDNQSREDLTDVTMVTIDGEDAKDLDDAVSIKKLDNGNYLLGVHIADVSHYVKEKNPLDREALKRATSVYLINKVIPMLPKELSNGICSLNPKVNRLAMTCFMEINDKGKVVDYRITKSIIKTNERMTYTDVTKILRDKDEETIEKYKDLYEDFKLMEKLCEILYKKRISRGAIDFEFEESKIILDDNGKPIDVKPYERAIANRIIEEFMLVCNETVAEHMYWTKLPFVYRIHEDPDEEKLQRFREFAYNLGYFIKPSKEVHPKALQEIIESVKGKKEETVVNTLLLRSLKQARYAPQCVGHFGLAAKFYCHFTSPIRRYPDLIIHRIIKESLDGTIDENRFRQLESAVDYASMQSSDMERLAMEAEREVDDLKKAEYMSTKIGEEYTGIVSSVTNFGMFVQLPNTIEGLIHISTMDDDYYVYDEDHLCLVGERRKNVYRLGDEAKIRVSRVDLASYEIYFDLIKEEEENEEHEIPEMPIENIGEQLILSEEDERLNDEIDKMLNK